MTPSNRTGSANAFILNYRRLARAPGIKRTTALALAKETFKEDWTAYQKALSEGVTLEPLDRKPDYAQRLQRSIQTGLING
jgi:hypothetical protein